MSASFLLQQAVNGLTLGAVYTLIALAFSVVMGILGILNLAIAELFMIAGFVCFTLLVNDFPLPVAIVGGMVAAALVSLVIEKIAYEPLRDAPPIMPMLSTLGFSIILQNVATNIWGSDPLQLDDKYLGTRLTFGDVSIGSMQLLVIVVTIVLVSMLAYLIRSTFMGLALRAVAENREVARLLGVRAQGVLMVAFLLSGLLAGTAGSLISLHYAAITPYIGVETGLKAIAVLVIGGATRMSGALIAGPLIGLAEVATITYGGSQLRDFVVYGLMIVILLVRPQGLLGGSQASSGGRV